MRRDISIFVVLFLFSLSVNQVYMQSSGEIEENTLDYISIEILNISLGT